MKKSITKSELREIVETNLSSMSEDALHQKTIQNDVTFEEHTLSSISHLKDEDQIEIDYDNLTYEILKKQKTLSNSAKLLLALPVMIVVIICTALMLFSIIFDGISYGIKQPCNFVVSKIKTLYANEQN